MVVRGNIDVGRAEGRLAGYEGGFQGSKEAGRVGGRWAEYEGGGQGRRG